MNKSVATFLSSILIFSWVGCGIHSHPSVHKTPTQATTPATSTVNSGPLEKKEESEKVVKENKKRIKTKSQISEELDSLEAIIKKNEELLATKRAEGINTSQAEKILQNSKDLLEEAERLYLEANITENYEPVTGLLQVIDDSFEKIKRELKKAPRFREKTKPQPKEFKDDRDIIIEKLGHPDPRNVRVGPMSRFTMLIHDPTSLLSGAIAWGCFDGMRTFILDPPPKVMIIEYNNGQEGVYQFVLIEDNPYLEDFTRNAQLIPEQRDRALSALCATRGSGFEHYRFVAAYKNQPVGTPEQYLEQLISGRFRFADQFGLGAQIENAKGAAMLADLELVSLVFNTKISSLNISQADALDKIHAKIKDILLSSENGQKAFAKIAAWQDTLSPKKDDKKQFLNLIRDNANRQEVEKLINDFEENLKKLADEFNKAQRELLRFKKNSGEELLFYNDESPVMVLLLQGVGYGIEEASARTLFKKDKPQILVESKVFYYASKNDEQPQLIRESQSMVNEANKYIDVSKEYQRLTSFILGWPSGKPLPAGYYHLKLTATDKIREKAIIYEANFTVLPASLRVRVD